MATKRPSFVLRSLRLLAFAATLLGGYKLVSTAIFKDASFFAQGIILDFEPTEEAFAPARTPLIAFIDFADQKQLATPESALGTEAAYLGQKVVIRYSPDNPRILRLDTFLGMWGSGVASLLFGLIPFLFFHTRIAKASKRTPARKSAKRKSTLNVSHLVDHTQNMTDTDKPVVRRMR
ncbi:MAG: hypothetical protein GQ535_15365 [Rhodobacteraceae bacterium]|nr:hypothetical protein [Paracoccaceae bacterium]